MEIIDWKKKYNEALEKIKRYTTDKYGCTRLKPADIFPELSNDDERMKKAIIDALNSHNNSINVLSSRGYLMDDVISYLEKKEQKFEEWNGEDERIRNEILEYFTITRARDFVANPERRKWISYIEKQKESIKEVEPITDGLNTEFQKQVSYLIASSINKEHEYSEGYVKWISQSLLEYAKKESVKGSDEDEQIRKAISCLVKNMPDNYGFAFGIGKSDMLAYLEKQKESGIRWYKSDNRSNPKKPYIDKAGMFYTTDGRMCYASEIEKQKEQTEELSTRLNGLMQEYVKSGKDEEEQEHRLKCYHLFWDALSDSEFFKQKESLHISETCKENADSFTDEDERIRAFLYDFIKVCAWSEKQYPPREKCLTYLGKQKESIEKEYVFRPLGGTDINIAAEQAIGRANKGDRLVLAFNGAYIPISKGCTVNKIVDAYNAFIEKHKEQKPANDKAFEEWVDGWWEEHKDKAYHEITMDKKEFKNFCRGIRNMYQQKPEWSEEDEWARNYLIEHLTNGMWIGEESERKLVTWLKSLRPQPKQEWNEEDKEILRAFKFICKKLIENPSGEKFSVDPPYAEKMLKFLESLCPDSKQEPICSWKPSKEQMGFLNGLLTTYMTVGQKQALKSLIGDLKKL